MKKRTRLNTLSLPIAASLLLVAGCSTPGAVARLEEEIVRTQEMAEEALRKASSAQIKADEAIAIIKKMQAAESGQGSTRALAEQALEKARQALTEAERAKKRADRMYRKALGK